MSHNNVSQPSMHETIWFDKPRYDEAERRFHENQARNVARETLKVSKQEVSVPALSLATEIASVREHITNTIKAAENIKFDQKDSLTLLSERVDCLSSVQDEFSARLEHMLKCSETVAKIEAQVVDLCSRMVIIEKEVKNKLMSTPKAKLHNHEAQNNDDDIDLFGSGEEDEETSNLRDTRLKAYEEKKSKKVPVIAKSFIILDVKPWSNETDLKEMERLVRAVKSDGLAWGEGKLVPIAYGVQSLQIAAVVEDDKVSIDWLQETLQEIVNFVQSVDIVAFNKL